MTGARIALPRPWRAAAAPARGGRSRRRLRRPVLVTVAVAVLLAVAWYWGRDLSLWSVDDVHVTGATGRDAAQINAALQSAAHGMTTLHVRRGDLRDAVARFPVVKALRVHASFPHGLRIEVVENIPVAALQASGRPVAAAADGTLLRDSPTDGLPTVPARTIPTRDRVTDAQAAGALALAGAAPPAVRALVVRVRSGGHAGLRADLRGGLRIDFGSRNRLHAKWAAAIRVMGDARAEGATYLDVRFPDRPVAGGAFVSPLPSAPAPAPPSATTSTPDATSTTGSAGTVPGGSGPSTEPQSQAEP
jgi:cell division protein FtsQ